jgi:putative DNA primase/helicase
MQAEGLEQPQAVRDATKQYREESDTVGLFIRECLVEMKRAKTPMKDVYAEYEKWCGNNGYNALNNRNLAGDLRRKGLNIKTADKNQLFLFDYGISYTGDLPDNF